MLSTENLQYIIERVNAGGYGPTIDTLLILVSTACSYFLISLFLMNRHSKEFTQFILHITELTINWYCRTIIRTPVADACRTRVMTYVELVGDTFFAFLSIGLYLVVFFILTAFIIKGNLFYGVCWLVVDLCLLRMVQIYLAGSTWAIHAIWTKLHRT